MADTKLIIELEILLRNLNKTLQGLDAVKKRLANLATIKIGASQTQSTNQATTASQRLALAQQRLQLQQQRLQLQQQRLAVSTQNVTTAQGRAALAAQRLQLAQQRLTQAQQRLVAGNVAAGKSTITLDQTLGRVGGSLRNLGLGLTSLGASLTVSLTAPLTALAVLSARNAITLDSLQRGLVAITGSASEAGRQLARLTEIAKLPGIGFQEAIQGSIRLQAVGFSAEVAEKALVQFSNAVALTGGGREELARITVQLGQLAAKGKVLAQDLKPIIEAGPAVGRALLQAFGTVNSEDIQALGLSSEQFIGTLIKQLEQLPRAAAGLRNTFDNFSDAVFRASAAIGGAILPVLTRLIVVAEPIITKLAEGFAKLPPVVQTLAIAFAALGAAAGPTLFILGQFATGIGGLISAFGRLHALGLLPTIASFRLLGQVMAGTASLAAGQVATTVAAAAGWGGLGLAILAVVAVAGGIALLLSQQKDAVKISKEQIAVTDAQIDALKDQLKFVNSLTDEVKRTADEEERLSQIYADLNTQAKIRITTITDESKRLAQLREELKQLLILREAERVQQAANLTASLAGTNARIEANQRDRNGIAERIRTNTELLKVLREGGQLTSEQVIALSVYENAVVGLNKENELLIERQGQLIKSSKELNGTAEEQATAIRVLQQQTGLTTRELLSAAKAMGVFKGDIDATLPSIEKYIKLQQDAATANEDFRKSLNKAGDDLIKAGERGEEAAKRRKAIIEAAATIARETSVDLRGATKSLRQQVDVIPELRAALRRESELTGKSVEQILIDALTKGLDKGGTSLRSAREQLADAILETVQAQAEAEIATQKTNNERLLEANELSYKLQLRSYREYLESRASFTDANLILEGQAATKAVEIARANEVRLRQAATKPGIPETERIKRLTQAEKANEEAIRAGIKLAEIERQREQVAAEVQQALAELAVQQVDDIRQLEIEYAELQGRIQDAFDAEIVERFRRRLEDLAKTQLLLRRQLEGATKAGNADRVKALTLDIQRNQREIDSITNQKRLRDALAELAAAEQLVTNAKERQRLLEQDLTFQVEFRGLAEEEAIRQRLAGEARLQRSLELSRSIIAATLKQLTDLGITPPPELKKFVEGLTQEIKGLGELPFTEQFRLVEKEFNRLNDERIRRIEDVERAVRNRTIAEVEGQILIRRINGEYTADLETQLVLLKQIAAASGQDELRQRALDAGETVRDTKDEVASLGKQIESAGKDAFRSGLIEFFNDIANRTVTAKEALLNLLNSITTAINNVIAENLSKKLFESLFGGAEGTGEGIIAKIRGFFGGGEDVGGPGADVAKGITETTAATSALTAGATAAATALTTGGTTAAAALTTGGAGASAALTAGGATAGASLVAAITAAAASFSAAVIAAGAAFAAAVTAAAASQGAASGLGALAGGAATGLFPAVPGGVYKFIEGGYPEAVLTTDPKHAANQVRILREFLARTKGLGGRIKGFAMGGFAIPDLSLNVPSVSLPNANFSDMQISSQQATNVRILNLLDKRQLVGGHLRSTEGAHDIMNVISENSEEIGRRLRIR